MQPISDRAEQAHVCAKKIPDTINRESHIGHPILARSVTAAEALVSRLGPMQISWPAARQSPAVIATRGDDSASISDLPMSWHTTGRIPVRWAVLQVEAARITNIGQRASFL